VSANQLTKQTSNQFSFNLTTTHLPRIAVNKNHGTVTMQAKASKNPPKLTRAELATSPFIKYDQEVVIPQAGQGKPSLSGKKQGAKPSC
jgi:hypothetical protein